MKYWVSSRSPEYVWLFGIKAIWMMRELHARSHLDKDGIIFIHCSTSQNMILLDVPELPSFQRVPSSSNSSIDVYRYDWLRHIWWVLNWMSILTIIDYHLGVKRIEKHVIGAKPLGGVDSRYEKGVFWALVDVDVQHLAWFCENIIWRVIFLSDEPSTSIMSLLTMPPSLPTVLSDEMISILFFKLMTKTALPCHSHQRRVVP